MCIRLDTSWNCIRLKSLLKYDPTIVIIVVTTVMFHVCGGYTLLGNTVGNYTLRAYNVCSMSDQIEPISDLCAFFFCI